MDEKTRLSLGVKINDSLFPTARRFDYNWNPGVM